MTQVIKLSYVPSSMDLTLKSIRKGEEFVVKISPDDLELILRYNWHLSQGYAKTSFNGRGGVAMSRIIKENLGDKPIDDRYDRVDHINGDRSDNTRENLRWITPQGNSANSRRQTRNKTGFKGVHYDGQLDTPFCAQIGSKGITIPLGHFRDAQSAHTAYCEAARRIHGEFARFS